MLRKVFQKLDISRAGIIDGRKSSASNSNGNIDGQGCLGATENLSDQPPFFNLSLDVLELVLKYLSFRDRIALSLTTKGLHYLYPEAQQSSPSASGPQSIRKLACARKVARSFLLVRPTSVLGPSLADADAASLSSVQHRIFKCPYCFHKLCLPTCATALFLDHATGVFYPSSLFPIEKAKFYYSYPCPIRRANGAITEPQGAYYSTIWCEHHRCPRDLLLKGNRYRDLKLGSDGKFHFLYEYKDGRRWFATRNNREPTATSSRVRWLIGHRQQYPLYLIVAAAGLKASNREERPNWAFNYAKTLEKKGWMEPVYEKFFYETVCRHCLLPLAYSAKLRGWRGRSPWFAETCQCEAQKPGGCRRCGVVSVKFTMVEVFDTLLDMYGAKEGLAKRESFWLFLASECKIVNYPSGQNKQRLEHIDPLEAERQLRVVRGVEVVPIARPRIGLQDLPYVNLLWVMTLHNRASDCQEYMYQNVVQSSYIFVKAWYGDSAPAMARGFIDMSAYRDRRMCWPEARPVKEEDTVRVKDV